MEDKECNAMLNRETDILQQLWAPDYMVNAPFNQVTFTRNIEQIMVKNDIAIAMDSEEVIPAGQMLKAGQTVTRRYTNIWIKQSGAWRLTVQHANEICE